MRTIVLVVAASTAVATAGCSSNSTPQSASPSASTSLTSASPSPAGPAGSIEDFVSAVRSNASLVRQAIAGVHGCPDSVCAFNAVVAGQNVALLDEGLKLAEERFGRPSAEIADLVAETHDACDRVAATTAGLHQGDNIGAAVLELDNLGGILDRWRPYGVS